MTIWPGNYYLIITSNYSIDMCVFHEVDREATKRRFTEWSIDSPQDTALMMRPCGLDDTQEDDRTIDEEE